VRLGSFLLSGGAAALIVVAGCSSSTTAASPRVTPSPPPASASPSATPAAVSPSPAKTPQPAVPSTATVYFSGLPSGVYPAHLHARCSGAQAFHLLVLANLVIAPGGAGSVRVPASYTGRGFCVIVYTSRTLTAVLTVKPV